MSASEDDQGFKPHPGDPWHPEWTEETAAPDDEQGQDDAALLEDALREQEDEPGRTKKAKEKKAKRGWFRRKKKPAPDEDEGEPPEFDDAEELEPPSSDDTVSEPAAPPAGSPEGEQTSGLPDWLTSAGASEAEAAAPPTEDPPQVPAVEEPSAPSAQPMPPRAPGADETERPAAEPDLDALAAALAAAEEDEEPEAPSQHEASPSSADAGHGVASTEVYESLRDAGEDDSQDWHAFVEGEEAPPDPEAATGVAPEAEVEPEDEPQRKRRIFGRRRRLEEADEELPEHGDEAEQVEGDETVVMEPEPAARDEEPLSPGLPSWASAPAGDAGTQLPPEQEAHEEAVTDGEAVEEPGEALPTAGGAPDVSDILEEPEPLEPAVEAPKDEQPLSDEPVDSSLFQPKEASEEADEQPWAPSVAAPDEEGEAVEPEGDSGRLPGSWFSGVDEAETGADLGEPEIPGEPSAAPSDAAGSEPVPGDPEEAGPEDVEWGVEEKEDAAWGSEQKEATEWGIEAKDVPWEVSEEEPGHPALHGDEEVVWTAAEGEPIPSSEEDVPHPDEAAPEVDDDDWVTGPIDVAEETGADDSDDADEEWSRTLYRGSVTTEHRGLAEEFARRTAEEDDTELQAISAPMAGLGTGVLGFEDVADLGAEEDEYAEPARSDLGIRILTAIVLLGLLFGSLWVSGEALAVFIGLIMMLGLGEFYATLRVKGYQPIALFGFIGGGAALLATWFYGPISVPVSIIVTAVLTFFFYAFAPRRRDALTNGGLTVLGVAWITGTAAFAFPILGHQHYRVLIFGVAAATVAMDVGAYFFGRTWGSSPLAPVLSPNKSVEGLAGGTVLAIAVAVLIGRTMEPFDIQAGAALGLVVAALAPAGDLVESMVKRSLGVKDMGSVLPGHGGVLDRVDAFLFVLPAAWVLFVVAGLI